MLANPANAASKSVVIAPLVASSVLRVARLAMLPRQSLRVKTRTPRRDRRGEHVLLAIPLRLVSGYAGGWIDDLIMRLIEAMLAIVLSNPGRQ